MLAASGAGHVGASTGPTGASDDVAMRYISSASDIRAIKTSNAATSTMYAAETFASSCTAFLSAESWSAGGSALCCFDCLCRRNMVDDVCVWRKGERAGAASPMGISDRGACENAWTGRIDRIKNNQIQTAAAAKPAQATECE